MPCNSDYMRANPIEISLSVVYGLLDEIKTGKLPKDFGSGYDQRIYNKGFSKNHLDKKTEELCTLLQNLDVTKHSLELQIWWRDHQNADRERILKEMAAVKEKADK